MRGKGACQPGPPSAVPNEMVRPVSGLVSAQMADRSPSHVERSGCMICGNSLTVAGAVPALRSTKSHSSANWQLISLGPGAHRLPV
jgi:hypothetical protein